MNSREGARRLLGLYRKLGAEESFNPVETAIMFKMLVYMNEDTYEAFPGEQLLARKLKISRMTLRKHISSLLERKAIEIVKNHGGQRCTTYKILWAMQEEPGQSSSVATSQAPAMRNVSRKLEDVDAYAGDLPDLPYHAPGQPSIDDNFYSEEVAFDIGDPGQGGSYEQDIEADRLAIRSKLFKSDQFLRLPGIFRTRLLNHNHTEEEAEALYREYKEVYTTR